MSRIDWQDDGAIGSTDASIMGFTPGHWPTRFDAPDSTGNVRTWVMVQTEINAVKYRNGDGAVVYVYRD